jgi:hypothetical protein
MARTGKVTVPRRSTTTRLPGLTALLAAFWVAVASAQQRLSDPVRYRGTCDASAAVALGPGLFVVGNDEDNVLRVYLADQPGAPLQESRVLYRYLGITPGGWREEADIEGAAWLGDRIYWIGSHGRNEKGKWRPHRLNFFATRVRVTWEGIVFEPVGHPYTKLLDDMLHDPGIAALGLADAVRPDVADDRQLAPKRSGVNIEGLAATADGTGVLIGFRNPRPDNKALIVRLNNPGAVLDGGARAKFDRPILLDLGGLGIRSIDFAARRRVYVIVAGPHGPGGPFRLYTWTGGRDTPPTLIMPIEGLQPEAAIVYPDRERLQILSDDGSLPIADAAGCGHPLRDGRCQCKDLPPDAWQFRSVWVDLSSD